jgi:RNA polymerase sigma-70 factor (ECF subfamily)
VVARRVVVKEILKRRIVPAPAAGSDMAQLEDRSSSVEERLQNREEIERLLGELSQDEAQVVRLFHLEGKSYQEISDQTGIPLNSVGPTLSRARAKMRQTGVDAAASS